VGRRGRYQTDEEECRCKAIRRHTVVNSIGRQPPA
jgi:hypothetical protein